MLSTTPEGAGLGHTKRTRNSPGCRVMQTKTILGSRTTGMNPVLARRLRFLSIEGYHSLHCDRESSSFWYRAPQRQTNNPKIREKQITPNGTKTFQVLNTSISWYHAFLPSLAPGRSSFIYDIYVISILSSGLRQMQIAKCVSFSNHYECGVSICDRAHSDKEDKVGVAFVFILV